MQDRLGCLGGTGCGKFISWLECYISRSESEYKENELQAATIKLFLVHGSPSGLRTAELSNWSGKAIAAPRTEISDLLKRDELNSPGIIF